MFTADTNQTYNISEHTDYDALDLEELEGLSNITDSFTDAVATKIEKTPAIQQAFNDLFEPQNGKTANVLTEAYVDVCQEHYVKFPATIEAAQDEVDPKQQSNMYKQAVIEHLRYADMYIKLIAGDFHAAADNAILSMPTLRATMPAGYDSAENIELLKEIGAQNLVEVASQAPMLN